MPTPTAGERIPMSWEEYVAVPWDRVRGEYIDGALVVMESPNRIHQDIAHRLHVVLETAVGDAARVTAGWGWKPTDDHFVPDLVVYAPTDEVTRLTALPHLAVEILSTDRAADTVRKFAKYAAAGLPRYWIIDPAGPDLLAFELGADGGYREIGEFGPEDDVRLDIGPAVVSFRPEELLD